MGVFFYTMVIAVLVIFSKQTGIFY
jgi:hypothetical protein